MAVQSLLATELQSEAQAALARAQAELQFALAALAAAGAPTAILDAGLHAAQTLDSAALAAAKPRVA